jgi:tetratricopeptide (TPR) repeat protein
MVKIASALCLMIAFANPSGNVVVIAEAPAQTVQSLLAEARDAQSRRDFNAAAESYRKAIELDPSVPELWANLGLMYHELAKRDEAIQTFKKAIRLDPSLFVPQLFVGIEYMGSKNPEAAVPFLEKAKELNPNDLQAVLNLGKAYTLLDRSDRAADAYSIATGLAPNDGSTWLSLGTAYLQQVEDDARLMSADHSHSAYFNLRAAESFAEEGKLVQAEDAYKLALASAAPPPCTHAEFGITLLRRKRIAEAREQFEIESRTAHHCGLAMVGLAIADLVERHPDLAFNKLSSIGTADSGFLRSSLRLFRDAVSADQTRSLIDLARARDNAVPPGDIASQIEEALGSIDVPLEVRSGEDARASGAETRLPASAERLSAAGEYAKCSNVLKPVQSTLGVGRLRLLASCSFWAGDFEATSIAAGRLKLEPSTRLEGLYWESKADQKLAIAALIRAGEIDADSPRMHILLGDVYRQKRRLDDAEAEYRKAVALDAKSHAARLSLAISLFSELKSDEAFEVDRSLLAEDPEDAEANLLAAEILVQRRLYDEAEPYLTKCTNLRPEFMPRLHILLGQIYAATDRLPKAIAEYKSGLVTDEDGSIHYQLARLYQKSGDNIDAQEAFKVSKFLRHQRDERARIALEQSSTDQSRQ